MKVQEILIDDKKRYVLIDENNRPVIPVIKYLKYLDNIRKAENTLESYYNVPQGLDTRSQK